MLYTTIANAGSSIVGVRDDNELEERDVIVPFSAKLIGVPQGTYSLRLLAGMVRRGASATCVAQTSNISMFAFKSIDNRAMIFGSDGMSLFWNQSAYFHLKNGACTARGAWDIPAGMGGGKVGSTGGILDKWGLAFGSSRSTSTTTIKHNVTDIKFTVNVIPKSSFTWYLSSISAASSPTENDGNIVIITSTTNAVFDFVIVRTPY